MSLGLKQFMAAAFNHRPWGMIIAPNWVGLAALGLLGFINPGFWIAGLGTELGYLLFLANNPRFQRLVRGQQLLQSQKDWMARQQQQLTTLSREDQDAYHFLERRCQAILEQQRTLDISPLDLQAQGQGLARLTWIYLRLLLTRAAINHTLADTMASEGAETFEERIARLQGQVKDPKISDDLRKSLAGQLDILQQRQVKQHEAKDKLAFLEAEMARIAEQVELIREQAAVAADPKAVSDRIDQVAADLTGRSQWLHEQQQMYGRVEDLLAEPPPISPAPAASLADPAAAAAAPPQTEPEQKA